MKLFDVEFGKILLAASSAPMVATTNWLVNAEPTIKAAVSGVALLTGIASLIYVIMKIQKLRKK